MREIFIDTIVGSISVSVEEMGSDKPIVNSVPLRIL